MMGNETSEVGNNNAILAQQQNLNVFYQFVHDTKLVRLISSIDLQEVSN